MRSRMKDTAPSIVRHDDADESSRSSAPRVLIVDDEPAVAAALARVVASIGADVSVLHDATLALRALETTEFDVIVSDLAMAGMSGTELLRAVRARDLDLPVIQITGAPSVESAASAVELGAFRYLTKPLSPDVLRKAVLEAARLRSLARARRGDDRARLDQALRRALKTLRVAYQPIVSCATRETIGYEALMRSTEPTLTSPAAVIDAAEKLGALHTLGRRVRNIVAAELDDAPRATTIFVNLHPSDLADPDLFDPSSPLSRFARQVVLELTERASLEAVPDLELRFHTLRSLGYRLAVDDLGAGYAGLSYFARVQPEIVKVDMSLVRGVDADVVRQRVVHSLVSLATGLGMEVVAEGIETAAERDTVVRLGCTYVQGYALARPGPAFPSITWP